jgi:hypothetical protein
VDMKSPGRHALLISLGLILGSVIATSATADSNQKNVALPYNKTVSGFPRTIKNYKLTKLKPFSSYRIFQGEKWAVPIPEFDPERNGGATMSCDPFFWILRWRSNNPTVILKVTKGMTDFGFEPTDKVVTGGAGYISDYSCKVPGFKFGNDLGGKGSTLVDLNMEYQIWSYNPKI